MTTYTLLVDGIATIPARPRPVSLARAYSRMYPASAVALCRLGDARSLRRFDRGVEVRP
mgnify:FL=1